MVLYPQIAGEPLLRTYDAPLHTSASSSAMVVSDLVRRVQHPWLLNTEESGPKFDMSVQ